MIAWLLFAGALTTAANVRSEIRAIAALAGEPRTVSAAGLAGNDEPILTLENTSAFDVVSRRRRLVIVGGLDGDERSVAAALALVRWLKTSAPVRTRQQWTVSALPSAAFAPTDRASLERWTTFQVPDVLIEVRGDGKTLELSSIKSTALDPAALATPTATAAALQKVLSNAPAAKSVLHDTIDGRVSRRPVDLAVLLAARYPATPGISYIPSVAWTNTLRLSRLLGDESLADKVRQQTAPWVSGDRPLWPTPGTSGTTGAPGTPGTSTPSGASEANRVLLTSVAGTMVFAELGGDAQRLALEGARLAAVRNDTGIARHGQGWTDDMFMASAILSRVGEFDAAARLLLDYAARLQRKDGIFIHATDGPFAWGRGNGFAALGMMELLTVLPDAHPARTDLLAAYRRQMAGIRGQQAPDGMWREVIDEPGAYREETATAMLTTAMARGIRRGWLDRSYEANVDRAWRGLLAHVKEDGTVIDVCTGTGAGPTKRYYLDRAAITGADDRGGAMALLAAMEMATR
jgi:unsaturated rhamnogalacturonyl hydrolase